MQIWHVSEHVGRCILQAPGGGAFWAAAPGMTRDFLGDFIFNLEWVQLGIPRDYMEEAGESRVSQVLPWFWNLPLLEEWMGR